MSDTAVDSLDTLADTSNASGTAPLLAPEANHTLQDTLSDPLADGADGDSVQMFAARPDDSVPSLRSLKHDPLIGAGDYRTGPVHCASTSSSNSSFKAMASCSPSSISDWTNRGSNNR